MTRVFPQWRESQIQHDFKEISITLLDQNIILWKCSLKEVCISLFRVDSSAAFCSKSQGEILYYIYFLPYTFHLTHLKLNIWVQKSGATLQWKALETSLFSQLQMVPLVFKLAGWETCACSLANCRVSIPKVAIRLSTPS